MKEEIVSIKGSLEAEECGVSAVSRVWFWLCKNSKLFSNGHKSPRGLSWRHFTWWALNGCEAYAHFNTSPHPWKGQLRNKAQFPFSLIYNSEASCKTISLVHINTLELSSLKLNWKEQSGGENSNLAIAVFQAFKLDFISSHNSQISCFNL